MTGPPAPDHSSRARPLSRWGPRRVHQEGRTRRAPGVVDSPRAHRLLWKVSPMRARVALRKEMRTVANSRLTLAQHLAQHRGSMAPEYASAIASIITRLGEVAPVIERELAHAALPDRLGYVGGPQ